MARKKNSEKSVTSNNDTRPETRKEKRERLARKRAKLAEHKKLVPVLVAGIAGVVIILPMIVVYLASLSGN
eukprot:CAMPEP_0195525422 /NCGR_PEP_ID=MMETSP0794_2-20130614/25878_1 /TAXON_ID=515487 /ORGANISM="Stephanopyxis turris, Strain CCMP 815" /LENGTH=70 /DNA_ID=CAMNT_0040655881 /DNA_START=74 /DNA_END=286 /DNA_ORIENTATION=-